MFSEIKLHKLFFIFLFIILFLNFLFWWHFGNVIDHGVAGGDQFFYHNTAQSLITARGYAFEGIKTMIREPGYSLFVAGHYLIFGARPLAVEITQLFLIYLVALLIYDFVRRNLDRKLARLSAVFVVLYPIFVIYASCLMSEIWALFLFSLFLYWFYFAQEKKSNLFYFLSGGALASLIMTKNMYLFLTPLFVALILYQNYKIQPTSKEKSFKKNWLFVLSFCLIPFFVVAGWSARNYFYFQTPTLASRGGTLLYVRAAKNTFSQDESLKYIISSVGGEYWVRRFWDSTYDYEQLGQSEKKLITKRQEISIRQNLTNYDQIDQVLGQVALGLVKNNLPKYFFWGFFEVNNLNSPIVYYERHTTMFHHDLLEHTSLKAFFLVLFRLIWYLFIYLVIYGIFVILKNKKRQLYGLVAVILYTNLVVFFLQGIPRFILPILPFYFLCALVAFYQLWRRKYPVV